MRSLSLWRGSVWCNCRGEAREGVERGGTTCEEMGKEVGKEVGEEVGEEVGKEVGKEVDEEVDEGRGSG